MVITFKSIIGKHILVGITYIRKGNKIIEQVQFDGKIIEAVENKWILIEKMDTNEVFKLPPDLSFIKIAEPGEYILKETGKVVVNPDLISTLIIKKKEK